MKKKILVRLCFICLTALMVFQMAAVSAVNTPKEYTDIEENTNLNSENSATESEIKTTTIYEGLKKGDMTLEQLQTAKLKESDIPEVVLKENIENLGHVNRLYEQEPDLSSVIFQNTDLTKTMYMFDSPVKYVDNFGKIKDKSNKLSFDNEKGYINKENDVKLAFPKALDSENKISLSYKDINISLAPLYEKDSISKITEKSDDIQNQAAAAKEIENIVSKAVLEKNEKAIADTIKYENAFGDNTSLRYTPTFEGFKEDIILDAYTGQNEFKFILDINIGKELQAEASKNRILFYDSDEYIAKLDPIYVYDSFIGEYDADKETHDTYDNEMKIEQNEDGSYLLTVIANREFLEDENTVYPVIVDPTLTINSLNGTKKNIVDACVYTGAPSEKFGMEGDNYIGIVGSAYGMNLGTGRMLLKFPALKNNTVFTSLYPYQILDLSFIAYTSQSASNASPLYAYWYNGAAWNENTVTYNSVKNYWSVSGSPQYQSNNVGTSYPSYMEFNLTENANIWSDNDYIADRGLIVKNSNELSQGYRKVLRSTDSSASGNKPQLVLTYSDITSLKVTPAKSERVSGEAFTISYTVTPDGPENMGVVVTSGNSNIVNVESVSYGKINLKAGNTAGNTNITVRSKYSPNVQSACNVKVLKLTASVLNQNMAKDATQQISIVDSLAGAVVTYTSSDTSIATVNSSGLVTGKGFGKATITVTSSLSGRPTQTAKVDVFVYDYQGITLKSWYDNGFSTRYADFASKISTAHSNANTVIQRIIGVKLTTSSGTLYTSSLDSCKGMPITLAKANAACSHTAKHTSWQKMHTDFSGNSTVKANSSNIKVWWTGHRNDMGAGFDPRFARSFAYENNVFMATDFNAETNKKPYTVFLHETLHTLGAEDTYCDAISSTRCNNPEYCTNKNHKFDEKGVEKKKVAITSANCLMHKTTMDITNPTYKDNPSNLLCSGCRDLIRSEIKNKYKDKKIS